MAKNRKNQAAAIRFAPALKASFLCLLIGGSAIGYVWQKNQIDRLGKQIVEREKHLIQLKHENERLQNQMSILHSPVRLDQRAKELNLGLSPASPTQVVRLQEPGAPDRDSNNQRQLASRPAHELTP
jgi:cell division protein FtsL